MNMPEITLFYSLAIIVLVVSDVLLVGLGMFIYRLRSHQVSPQPVAQDSDDQGLRQDLKMMTVSMSVLGERLARIESRIERLREGGLQGSVGREGSRKAFEVASKLALEGAKVEELVNLCGLTRGEAELVHVIYKQARETGSRPQSVS